MTRVDTYRILVPAFSIPYSKKQLSDTLTLNQFQEEVQELVNKGEDVVLTAPTGAGKTLTLLLNTEIGKPVLGGHRLTGFIALYPNNTLLLNQMCTVEGILKEHLGAKIVQSNGSSEGQSCAAGTLVQKGSPLIVYEVDESRAGGAWGGSRYVALLALSGRYVVSPEGEPKREVIERLVSKIYDYARKKDTYLIVFATPDTFLLMSTGAYRDFENVGKSVHNLLLTLAEDKTPGEIESILRRTGVIIRDEVASISTAIRLSSLPLFIDEFHLYGPYEVDALIPTIALYKKHLGENSPIVFSSATPAEEVLNEVQKGLKSFDVKLNLNNNVKSQVVEGGDGFKVRGDTEFILLPVEGVKKGLTSYFKASEKVPDIVREKLVGELESLSRGRALIIVDRLWMVHYLAENLKGRGLKVDCIASIIPPGNCTPGSNIIVGSEATTQGVNLGEVVLGVTGGTSSEDVVQRIGRIGRRGVSSKVYLVLPEYAIDENPPREKMGYYELVDWVNKAYPNYPKRRRDTANLLPERFRVWRRYLIYSLGIASLARITGAVKIEKKDDYELLRPHAQSLLNDFIGSPTSLTKLLLFRRIGFTVKYKIVSESGDPVSQPGGEESIGLLTRNFEIKGVDNAGTLYISLQRLRSILKIVVDVNPSHYSGKILELRFLLEALRGNLHIGDNLLLDASQVRDALVYVGDFGNEISEYLSYTGEGAELSSIRGSRYAIVFV